MQEGRCAIRLLDQLPLSYAGDGVFAVGLHVLAVILCTVAAMGAVHRRFRQQDGIRRTTALIGLFLLVGGAASVAPTMALAAWLGYSSQAPVVLLELGVVVTFCVAGLRTARWISTRTSATSAGA